MMKLAWIYDIHQVAAQMSLYLLHIMCPNVMANKGGAAVRTLVVVHLPSP